MEKYKHEFIKPIDGIDVFIKFSIDTGSVINKHFHDWIEIVYIIRGGLEFQCNNKTIHLEETDFIVVNPMSIHSTRCIDGNTAILLQIPISFLQKFVPDISKYHFDVDIHSENPRVQTKITKMREIMTDLLIAYEFQVEGYIFRCYSLIFELIYILVHSFSHEIKEIDRIKSEKNMERMQYIMNFIKHHYMEDISLDRISNEIGLNSVYFSRFFKKHMGITFLEYLNMVRLENIHTDIINTDLTIKEIQEKHGFYNYKLFMKMFKNTYGCTPKEARKRNV